MQRSYPLRQLISTAGEIRQQIQKLFARILSWTISHLFCLWTILYVNALNMSHHRFLVYTEPPLQYQKYQPWPRISKEVLSSLFIIYIVGSSPSSSYIAQWSRDALKPIIALGSFINDIYISYIRCNISADQHHRSDFSSILALFTSTNYITHYLHLTTMHHVMEWPIGSLDWSIHPCPSSVGHDKTGEEKDSHRSLPPPLLSIGIPRNLGQPSPTSPL